MCPVAGGGCITSTPCASSSQPYTWLRAGTEGAVGWRCCCSVLGACAAVCSGACLQSRTNMCRGPLQGACCAQVTSCGRSWPNETAASVAELCRVVDQPTPMPARLCFAVQAYHGQASGQCCDNGVSAWRRLARLQHCRRAGSMSMSMWTCKHCRLLRASHLNVFFTHAACGE